MDGERDSIELREGESRHRHSGPGKRTFSRDKCENLIIRPQILGIAEGLKYLHDEGVIHSDIKAGNVLISSIGVPRICDFGISRMLASSQTFDVTTSGHLKGTTRWMAKELMMIGDPPPAHTFQTDVWAFGMTVHVRSALILSSFCLTAFEGTTHERATICGDQK